MFDKDEYWKNRKLGLRGQGEPDLGIVRYTPEEWKKLKDEEKKAKEAKNETN
jgi:hypothetical protein